MTQHLAVINSAMQREVYNPKAEARLQSYTGGGPRIAQVPERRGTI